MDISYIGNLKTKNIASCPYASKISDDHRVTFSSAEEAEEEGYEPMPVLFNDDLIFT